MRGHGDSGRPDDSVAYRVEDYTADVVAFLERVVGRPAVVVGHSLGGLVAAHLTSTRNDLVAAVLLEDPPLYFGDRDVYEATVFSQFFPLARELFRSFRDQHASVDDVYEAIRHLPHGIGDGTLEEVDGINAVRRQARIWHRFDPEAFGPAIDGTLFTAYDPGLPLRRHAQVLRAERALGAAFFAEHEAPFLTTNPQASVDLVPGASHLVHEDAPETVVAALVSLLARVR